MELIRIAQVIGKMNGGGVEAVVMNYYRHIDKSMVQFDFIIDNDSTIIPREEIENMGGRIIEIPPYQKPFAYHKALVKVLKENKYKIVHAHINTLNVFPLFAAWRAGVEVRISHNHSTAHKNEGKRTILKYILRPFTPLFATHYFACGEYAGRWMYGNNRFNKGKVKVINNAIDLNKFAFDKNIRTDIRKNLDIDDKFVVGHIGRFAHVKNHWFLIDIFNEIHKKNSNAVLLLVGIGELQKEIQKKVKKIGLEDFVIFAYQTKDTSRYYQAIDAFVLPSFYEGLPVVGVEAQANGLPCFFSDQMTKEIKMLTSTQIIALYEPIEKWADMIALAKRIDEKKCNDEIRNAGYNIETEALKLQDIYIKMATMPFILYY